MHSREYLHGYKWRRERKEESPRRPRLELYERNILIGEMAPRAITGVEQRTRATKLLATPVDPIKSSAVKARIWSACECISQRCEREGKKKNREKKFSKRERELTPPIRHFGGIRFLNCTRRGAPEGFLNRRFFDKFAARIARGFDHAAIRTIP